MADQLDNRPVFTVVLGCAGAGKTAWEPENWDRLPDWYFDHDSFAGGVGDWDTAAAKAIGASVRRRGDRQGHRGPTGLRRREHVSGRFRA